ncbi:MAG: glycosyltransferase [Cyanothece sp. SIO1E1]|nr:glycosyltransferase [Cyanothece sp. SIO1E1]
MPLISVIIPAYNAEKTIRETIGSVLDQTFSDFELIVINDGSQDATLDIVNSIQDPRLKIFSYPNSGPQKSRNRGISHACSESEYFSFLDSDDLWTPDKLAAQLKALQENPQAGGVYSWTNYIDQSGKLLRQGPHFEFSGDIHAKLLLADFIGSGSNPLLRKQAVAKVGNFDEAIVGGQDWDMYLRVAAEYPFEVVPSVQILHRKAYGKSAKSWSANVERQEAGFKQVITKALERDPKTLQPIKKHIIANRYKTLAFDALQGYPEQKRGLTGARYLWRAISNDSDMLWNKVTWKAWMKIFIVVLLPAGIAQQLINKMKRLYSVDVLLSLVKLNP